MIEVCLRFVIIFDLRKGLGSVISPTEPTSIGVQLKLRFLIYMRYVNVTGAWDAVCVSSSKFVKERQSSRLTLL